MGAREYLANRMRSPARREKSAMRRRESRLEHVPALSVRHFYAASSLASGARSARLPAAWARPVKMLDVTCDRLGADAETYERDLVDAYDGRAREACVTAASER